MARLFCGGSDVDKGGAITVKREKLVVDVGHFSLRISLNTSFECALWTCCNGPDSWIKVDTSLHGSMRSKTSCKMICFHGEERQRDISIPHFVLGTKLLPWKLLLLISRGL